MLFNLQIDKVLKSNSKWDKKTKLLKPGEGLKKHYLCWSKGQEFKKASYIHWLEKSKFVALKAKISRGKITKLFIQLGR